MSFCSIILGGRSPIAISCARELSITHHVYLVTRDAHSNGLEDIKNNNNISICECDLLDLASVKLMVSKILDTGQVIRNLICLQRYRPSLGESPSIEEHLKVEVWSIQSIIDIISTRSDGSTFFNVLVSTSPAASKVLVDQDLNYHIVKSAQESLVRYYGATLNYKRFGFLSVRLGSIIIKKRAEGYWNSISPIVEKLKGISPSKNLQSSEFVGKILADLCGLELSTTLNGQSIELDDGFNLRDGCQMAKSVLEEK